MTTNDLGDDASGNGSRRRGRPRDAARDKAILAATLEILGQRGYSGLTIEGVALSAGVTRPTIYLRWPSKPALVVAALVQSAQIALRVVDTGSLRRDLIAMQRRQVALMNSPDGRRVTAGLVADLAADPELAESYVSQHLVPRRAIVWQVLQRGVDRGDLDADADFALLYDLLVGPLFMRAVVWGEQLPPETAETTADVILAAFAPNSQPPPSTGKVRKRSASA